MQLLLRLIRSLFMKVLHAFDYDDTLAYTPTFAAYLGADDGTVDVGTSSDGDSNKAQLRKIQHVFRLVFGKSVAFKVQGDFIVLVDQRTDRVLTGEYIGIIQDRVDSILKHTSPQDVLKKMGVKISDLKGLGKSLVDEGGLLAIKEIKGFHNDELTIGAKVNEQLVNVYENASNKMIVTGRSDRLKKAIDMNLRWMEISYPNLGLHCYPVGAKTNIPNWKADVIMNAIQSEGFDVVHYYEDKADWLQIVEDRIKVSFGDIEFHGHHITNIRLSKSI